MTQQNFTMLLELVVKDRSSGAKSTSEALDGVTKASESANKSLSLWTVKRTGEGIARVGQSMLGVVGDAVKASASIEAAGSSLRFLTRAQKETDVTNLIEGLRDLSTKVPGTEQDFLKMAVAAKRAGGDFDDLKDITESAARAQFVLGISGEETITVLSRMRKNAGLGNLAFEKMAGAISVAANNLPAGAAETVKVMERSTAPLTAMGFQLGEQAALAAAAFGSGLRPARIASTFQKMRQTFGDVSNFDKIGAFLGETEEGMQAIAKQEGTAGIFRRFIPAIKDLTELQKISVLKDVGLTQSTAVNLVDSLGKNWDTLNGKLANGKTLIAAANDELKDEGTAAMDAYNISQETLAQKWERFTNTLLRFQSMVGDVFKDQLKGVVEKLKEFATWLTELSPEVKKFFVILFTGIAVGLVILGGFIAAIAGVQLAMLSWTIVNEQMMSNFVKMGESIKGASIWTWKQAAADRMSAFWLGVKAKASAVATFVTNRQTRAAMLSALWANIASKAMKAWAIVTNLFSVATIKAGIAWMVAFWPIVLIVGLIIGMIGALMVVVKQFGGSWTKIFGVVKSVFKGVFSFILVVVKAVANYFIFMINRMIDIVNLAIRAWNLVPWHDSIDLVSKVDYVALTGDEGEAAPEKDGVPSPSDIAEKDIAVNTLPNVDSSTAEELLAAATNSADAGGDAVTVVTVNIDGEALKDNESMGEATSTEKSSGSPVSGKGVA